jgi:hypothetical protein
MRKISLAVVVSVALVSLPLAAESSRYDRDEHSLSVRIVRVIKAVWGVRANGDMLTPPLPVAPPRP